MRSLRFRMIIVALMWVFGVVVLPFVPDPAPIHWNAAGEVDSYGSRWIAALAPAIGATIVAGLVPLLPRIDPRGQGYIAFSRTYALIMNSLILFLAAIQIISVGAAVGWSFSVPRLTCIGMALLIVVLGNELGRVKPNYFVGIRTPWTLADDEVWRKTHRVGARIMVGSGLVAVLVSLFLPEHWLLVAVLVLIILPVLSTIPYSYVVWRQAKHRQVG